MSSTWNISQAGLPTLASTFYNNVIDVSSSYGFALSASTNRFVNVDTLVQITLWIWTCFTLSNLWKALAFILIAINFKSVPFVYHLRILNGIRHVLKSQRSPKSLTPDQLFQPLITSSRAPLMEIDVFGHKSNSTYFSDIDIARTHFVTTMFSKSIEQFRGSTTMNGLSGHKRSAFTMPLGAVSCVFKRELKPYEKYDMWTRILSWDEKWFYLVTHFVKSGARVDPTEFTMYPQQMGKVGAKSGKSAQKACVASALSKVVFKDGRMTVAPEVMLQLAGLLPPCHEKVKQEPKVLDKGQIKTIDDAGNVSGLSAVLSERQDSSDQDSGYSGSRRPSLDDNDGQSVRRRIEEERVRGMELARSLAELSNLEDHFTGNSAPALARHYDGHGIEGVISTLAQLGKLSNYQLL